MAMISFAPSENPVGRPRIFEWVGRIEQGEMNPGATEHEWKTTSLARPQSPNVKLDAIRVVNFCFLLY